MLRLGSAVLGSVLFTAPAIAQNATPAPQPTPDFSKVEIKTTKVAGNIWLLEGQGGNIAVSAGPDGLLIVDDQFAPLADKIKAALRSIDKGDLEFSSNPRQGSGAHRSLASPPAGSPEYVLNTHWHGDHTGGNPVFGLEALIVAHENVRQRLSTEQTVRGVKVPPIAKSGLPVITFADGLSIHWNGEEIRMIHAEPSHTDTDSLIHFPQSNVLHMGDVFVNGRFPFVDMGSGGRVEGIARTVARVLEKYPADVRIIPGHGALATRADLELYQRMLEESIQTVEAGIEKGSPLADIQKAGLSAEWKSWGSFGRTQDAWIESVYNSLRER